MGNPTTSIPKGTRDFLPEEMSRRKYIFNTIESIYQRFGFLPIETPAMEQMTTLTGKYGDEGDKLLFRVLNSGDFLKKADQSILQHGDVKQLAPMISEKGLRYDLTVPFARFVVQHRNELTFPFRRYQIQPVWRADRPQKGRYREFYQCDADVIGSDSLLNEAELVQIIDEVFKALGINVIIRLNNRKVLAGIAEYLGRPEMMNDLTVALDKLDKIGKDGVRAELIKRGFKGEEIVRVIPVTELTGDTNDRLNALEGMIGDTDSGQKGIAELKQLFAYLELTEMKNEVIADLSLARGLDYYTGTIIEVVAKDHSIGSICGGGRYDDLTGVFGMKGVSGVGMSFGADRIYDVMLALGLFPDKAEGHSQLMFINFGGEDEKESIRWLTKVREAGVASEIYPDKAKIKKQMSYADSLGIPYVAFLGEAERKEGVVKLREMATGDESMVNLDSLIEKLSR